MIGFSILLGGRDCLIVGIGEEVGGTVYLFTQSIPDKGKKNCKIYFKSLLFISLNSDTEVD